jgi:peptidyl-prolyl cis-trans isomerase A (cyclophilin A)
MSNSINRRDVLAGVGVLAATPALAQTPPVSTPAPVRVDLQTGEGLIVLELYPDKAPITVANFLRYVDQKRYDGATMYRAVPVPNAPNFGLIQGGVQNDPKRVLKPIAHESTLQTGLLHKDGTISMGRWEPGTATSDFFICIGDTPSLDADPKAPGDNQGFAAFGKVVEGMDVARKILVLPTSPTAGSEAMRGQMLAKPVPIVSARRSKPAPAPAAAPPTP